MSQFLKALQQLESKHLLAPAPSDLVPEESQSIPNREDELRSQPDDAYSAPRTEITGAGLIESYGSIIAVANPAEMFDRHDDQWRTGGAEAARPVANLDLPSGPSSDGALHSVVEGQEPDPIAAIGNQVDLDALHDLLSESLSEDRPTFTTSHTNGGVGTALESPKSAFHDHTPDRSTGATDAAVRQLCQNVLARVPAGESTVQLFVSPSQSSTTAESVLDLAVQLVDSAGGDVLVVDANFFEPSLAQRFVAKSQPGLADILLHKTPWREVVQPTAVDGVRFLSPGPLLSPGQNIDPSRLQVLLQDLKRHFKMVLVEAGPVSQPHIQQLAAFCDGTYLVVELGRTSQCEVTASVKALRSAGAKLLGGVITGAPASN